MSALGELPYHLLDFADIFGCIRLEIVLEDAELTHRFLELGIEVLDDRVVILTGFDSRLDAAIVDVGDVLHVRHAIPAVGQVPAQHVEKKKGARMTEMRLRGRRQTADIDAYLAFAQRLELLDRARSSVVEF